MMNILGDLKFISWMTKIMKAIRVLDPEFADDMLLGQQAFLPNCYIIWTRGTSEEKMIQYLYSLYNLRNEARKSQRSPNNG